MGVTFWTRCETFEVSAPSLGHYGMMGLPSASTLRRRGPDSLQTFGFVFATLQAAHLVNREMDRYLTFLKGHRGHDLRLLGDSGSEDMRGMPEWSVATEPPDPPKGPHTYVDAYYGVFCECCRLAAVSKQTDQLRRFAPTVLTSDAVRRFVNHPVDDDIYRAAPLSGPDLEALSVFIAGHRRHRLRVQLLRTSKERAAFVPRIAPPSVVPPAGKAKRFECGDGPARKFWRIWLDGCRLNVHFGRVGSPGRMQTRVYPEPIMAEGWFRRSIEQKQAQGYVKVRDRR